MRELFVKTPLEEIISLDKIITIYYFEFASDYVFHGEKHDFWELLYVDKGEVEIMADTEGYRLEQGDIVFHKPNEFHSVWANGIIAPNIVVISFECFSPSMDFFENKILKLNNYQKNLLGEIIKEGKEAYKNDLGKEYSQLIKNENMNFGAEQMVKLFLQIFLIQLVRNSTSVTNKERLSFETKERMEEDMICSIVEYLEENVYKNIRFADVSTKFLMGKTHLKTTFKKITNQGVISYFRMLKMEEAKKLIRERKYNFTQISEMLGYDSIHYFSHTFKNFTGMTPSQYAVSIKAIAQI